MTKPGGIVAFTCASTGRAEHGTTRSDGGFAAPLNVQNGIEYYQNVTKSQVSSAVDKSAFAHFRIFRNYISSDLYFVGIKEGASEPDRRKLIAFTTRYQGHLATSGSASLSTKALLKLSELLARFKRN